MAVSNNRILKEYFADLAGVDSTGKTFNTCLRLGLESAGYTGSLNKMLRAWANATAGTSNLSLTVALKLAFATAQGSTQSSLAGLIGDFAGDSSNWVDQLQSFSQEGRTYLEFD